MPALKKPNTDKLLLKFSGDNRQHAEQVATEEHGGNLTAYINALILADKKRRSRPR